MALTFSCATMTPTEHQEEIIATTVNTADLTERQQQVLDLLLPPHNLAAREIGERLGISRNAVYQTINRLKKVGVWSGSESPASPAPSAQALTRITEAGSAGAGDRDQRRTTDVPLSAQLLTELATTQQELAKIANRLHKYLG